MIHKLFPKGLEYLHCETFVEEPNCSIFRDDLFVTTTTFAKRY